jgi:hypothetical protein
MKRRSLAALLLFCPGGEELILAVAKLQMAGLALLGIGVAGQWRASVHLAD